MTPLTPGSADALLFDLGRVVLDIDFSRAMACWARHSGCDVADMTARFSGGEAIRQYESGKIDDTAYFAHLRKMLDVDITHEQLLEGWNAIFVGEMPGIAPLLARAAKRLPLYALLQHQPAAYRALLESACRRARPFQRNVSVLVNRASETGRGGL